MKPPQILLVEDNPDDEELARRAFRLAGVDCQLAVARDGAEALDFLLGTGSRLEADPLPTVVLLDLNLPKIDGVEVLRRLRSTERTRFVPVVVLTTSHDSSDVTRSYAAGANGYIQKPLSFEAFLEVVRRVAEYWLTINRAPGSGGRAP